MNSSARRSWGCRCSRRHRAGSLWTACSCISEKVSHEPNDLGRSRRVRSEGGDNLEGMRRYFHEEAHLPVEVVLFQSYEIEVAALLAGPDNSTRA